MSMDRTPTRLRPYWDSRVPTMSGHSRSNPGGGAQPTWSADGRRLAFLARVLVDRRDVHIVDADGRNLRNVSNSPEDENGLAWSPDGTRLAYVRNPRHRPMPTRSSWSPMPICGSNARPVPGPRLSPYQLLWSPDGARLLGLAFADADKGPNANENTIIELDPSWAARAGHDRDLTLRNRLLPAPRPLNSGCSHIVPAHHTRAVYRFGNTLRPSSGISCGDLVGAAGFLPTTTSPPALALACSYGTAHIYPLIGMRGWRLAPGTARGVRQGGDCGSPSRDASDRRSSAAWSLEGSLGNGSARAPAPTRR